MALQTSGQISMSDINVELGNNSNAQISLNDTAVRDLAGISSGQISLSDFYGAAAVDIYAPQTFDFSTGFMSYQYAENENIDLGNAQPYGFDPSGHYFFSGTYRDSIRRFYTPTPFSITSLNRNPDQELERDFINFPYWVEFSRDGTRIFTGGYDPDVFLAAAILSNPWDLSSVGSWSYYTPFNSRYTNQIRFSYDGMKIFTTGYSASSGLRQYNLTSPWNISSASHVYTHGNYNTESLFISGDGQTMLYYDAAYGSAVQIKLSTPYNLNSIYSTTPLSYIYPERGLYVTPDANNIIVYDQGGDELQAWF